jgi:ectoine hydroxylase-related dioxygenase (phytanoyl-CoA dioxygenase family)
MGGLAILEGSHRAESTAKLRETYGKMDVDRDNVSGWFSDDPIEMVEKFGGRWLTTEFEPGDAIFFGMFTLHGSLNNSTNRYRLSCDTRYQLASEPADERWVGENPKGHYAWNKAAAVPMTVAREKWGV